MTFYDWRLRYLIWKCQHIILLLNYAVFILSSFLARLLIKCWNCCILRMFSSRDSSVGRAEDCRVCTTVILRSVVQIRLAGMVLLIFKASTHVCRLMQECMLLHILIFFSNIHLQRKPVNQKKNVSLKTEWSVEKFPF